MADQKIYRIEINGIEESVSKVDALLAKLNDLENRLMDLSSKTISVTVDGETFSATPTVSVDASFVEDRADLEALEAKAKEVANAIKQEAKESAEAIQKGSEEAALAVIEAQEREKEATKQATKEMKGYFGAMFAEERLQSDNYGNSLDGLRAKLIDMKKVIARTDVDSDAFKQLTDEANELNTKIKDIEQSYGQFGRNVGNYKSAAEGFKQISVVVGGVERQFGSVREASRELNQELKAMVINGQEDTDEFKDLSKAVHEFDMSVQRADSAVKDLQSSSQGMDTMLDTFQSLSSLGAIGGGIQAFLGSDADLQRSIQKLLALQNVLKGIESLRKQMNTGEGLGKYFAKADAKIGKFTKSVTTSSFAMKLFGGSMEQATAAAVGLQVALDALGIGLVLIAIALLMEGIEWVTEKTADWIKGDADAINQEDLLAASINEVNDRLRARNELLRSSMNQGLIDESKALEMQYKNEADTILELIEKYKEYAEAQDMLKNPKEEGYGGGENWLTKYWNFITQGAVHLKQTYKTAEEARKAMDNMTDAIEKNVDMYSNLESQAGSTLEKVGLWWKGLWTTVGDTKDELGGLQRDLLADFTNDLQQAMTDVQNGVAGAQERVEKLYEQMENDKHLKAAIQNIDNLFDESEQAQKMYLQALLENFKGLIEEEKAVYTEYDQFIDNMRVLEAEADGNDKDAAIARLKAKHKKEIIELQNQFEKLKRENKKGLAKINAEIAAMNAEERVMTNKHYAALIKAREGYLKRLNELDKQYGKAKTNQQKKQKKEEQKVVEQENKKIEAEAERTRKEQENQEKLLQQSRIDLMDDSLNKRLIKLEEERRQALAKLKSNSKYYKEYELNINKLYDKKEVEERKKYNKEIEALYDNLYSSIYNLAQDNRRNMLSVYEQEVEDFKDYMSKMSMSGKDVTISYGVQSPDSYSPSTKAQLGLVTDKELKDAYGKEMFEDAKQELELLKQIEEKKIAIRTQEELSTSAINANRKAYEQNIAIIKEKEEELDRFKDDYDEVMYNDAKKSIENLKEESKIVYETREEEILRSSKRMQVELQKAEDEYFNYQTAMRYKYSDNIQRLEYIELSNILDSTEKYHSRLAQTFNTRMNLVEEHWKERRDYELGQAEALQKKLLEENSISMKVELDANQYAADKEGKLLDEQLSNNLITIEEHNQKLNELNEKYGDKALQIVEYYNNRENELKSDVLNARYVLMMDEARKEIELEKQSEDARFKEWQDKQQELYKKEKADIDAYHDSKKTSEEDYQSELAELQDKFYQMSEQALREHNQKMELLDKEYLSKSDEIEIKKTTDIQKDNGEYYNQRMQEYRDFMSAMSELERKQPITDSWGLINIGATRRNNKELKEAYTTLADQIRATKEKLNQDLKDGLIDKETYEQQIRELEYAAADIGDRIEEMNEKLSGTQIYEYVIDNINKYASTVVSAFQQVISTIGQYEQAVYQERLDKMQDFIDKYSELLDKQAEITQQHAEKVNDIEDELSSARGDRRQHLIDQLNQEIEAQRMSAAEEKRIEKEKERKEKEAERLQKEKDKKAHQREIQQAIASQALAIVNALATKPWQVGLIMGSLAASLTAVQIATLKKQKYAEGGLLPVHGRRHSQGGMPIAGTNMEVEGGEYVIKRSTTTKNVALLDYINKSNKKLNIEDFIEFYSAKRTPHKNIVKTKFADGGSIPMLRTDISFNDKLINAFEEYAERPSVVQVVDIIKQQDSVKKVQVMAGLK